jgi:hypothetical protein
MPTVKAVDAARLNLEERFEIGLEASERKTPTASSIASMRAFTNGPSVVTIPKAYFDQKDARKVSGTGR